MNTRLVVGAALLLAATLQIHRIDDPDTWWHLATGRAIWATGTVPAVDPFSFTAIGAPWINRQWLFELLLYGAWGLGGPSGPILFAGAGFVAAFTLSAATVSRRLPAWASGALVIGAVLVAVERFTVRPEAATLPLLAATIYLVDGVVTSRRLVALLLLQVLWANCHALSILGLVPIGAALVGGLLKRSMPPTARWRPADDRAPTELRYLATALGGGGIAQILTPFGLQGALYPLYLLSLIRGDQRLSFTIVEHRATSLAELTPAAGGALVVLVAFGMFALLWSIRRLRVDHAISAIIFVGLGLMARRNLALIGVGVAPLVASGLGPMARTIDAWLHRHRAVRLVNATVALAAVGLVAGVVTGSFYQATGLTRTFGLGESWVMFPAKAVDFLDRTAPQARVFNDDVLGGYLIWRGRPVFFDGRLQVYPEAVYADWQNVLEDPQRFAVVANRWKLDAVLLHHPSPGRLELAQSIANLPGWRIAFLDGTGIVLLADGRPAGDPEGITDPAQGSYTPGLAGLIEPAIAPLRRTNETATTYYHRGRAIMRLWGAKAASFAARDFRAALELEPHEADAERGLRATRGQE